MIKTVLRIIRKKLLKAVLNTKKVLSTITEDDMLKDDYMSDKQTIIIRLPLDKDIALVNAFAWTFPNGTNLDEYSFCIEYWLDNDTIHYFLIGDRETRDITNYYSIDKVLDKIVRKAYQNM